MMKTTNLKKMTMAVVAIAMTACSSNSDLYDASKVENNLKANYAENFAKAYPNTTLNQSWDFTCKSPSYSLPGGNKARTRAGEYTFTTSQNYYEVDNNTLTWMQDKLKEGEPNKSLGNPFFMTVPGTEFTIVPIFQGAASAIWDLHLVVDGEDILVWKKSQDIQVKDDDNSEWHAIHQKIGPNDVRPGYFYEMDYNTIYSDNVRAKEYTFSSLPVGADMYFYLDIKADGNYYDEHGEFHHYNNVGAKLSSIQGMMLALEDVPRPANISEDNEVMIIACEDADQDASDWDMNDVVFLVYGKNVPKPLEITDGTPVVQTREARYLVEDLGAIDDFDFNDIVVDVTQTITSTPILTNGVITGMKPGVIKQEAIIRHLGGTLPFKLTIGNTEFPILGGEDTFQTSPDLKFEITGWNPDTHNISVEVEQQGSNGVFFNTVAFPKAGEAPMIIAVDPSQKWMNERQSVPESWFTTAE